MVWDICLRTGYSKAKDTPPTKNVNKGIIVIIPTDIKKEGIRLPVCSCCFLAYFSTKIIAIIDAIIE